MVREPVVAGQFYEEEFDKLNKQLEFLFSSERGPGDLPVKRGKSKIKAVIVPHAGYFFSGQCAAWAYKEVAEAEFPKAYIILAPNHNDYSSGISIEDWRTPLGLVKTDKDIIRGLKENTELEINESAHNSEHSLEVQLPLLQFVSKDKLGQLRIVPITIGRDIAYDKLGEDLFKYFLKKNIVFIISSDFTHYGPNYRYVPFTTDIPDRLNNLDLGAIDLIKKIDFKGFADYVNKTNITICGYMPILILLKLLSLYEMQPKAELLMHYTSADILGDHRNSVSYVSIVFR